MKHIIIKKFIIYCILLTIMGIFAQILYMDSENTLTNKIGDSLLILSLGAMLFDIGKSITNKKVHIKYIIYTSILVGEILLMVVISKLLGVSTENTWLGTIGTIIIFTTLSIVLFNIAKAVKNTHLGLSIFLYLIIFILIIGMIVNFILLFN